MAQKIEVAAGIKTGEFAAGAREIVAETQKMAQGVEAAGSGFQSFGDRAKAAFGALGGFARAAGIAVGIGAVTTALVASGRAFLQYGDNLNKASQKFGASVEALSQLKYAAQLSDVTFQQLESGLSGLSKAMEKAADGNKKQVAAFQELGVSIYDAQGNLRPLTSVLIDLSSAFEKMPNGANEAALAMRLMGTSGRELLPLLNQGPEAMRKLAKEADTLGLTMSTSAAQGAERFNDAWTRISAALAGATVGFWSELIEGSAGASEAIADFIVSIGGLDEVGAAIGSALSGTVSVISTFISAVFQLSRGIVVAMNEVVQAVTGVDLISVFSEFGSQLPEVLSTIRDFVVGAKDAFENFLDPSVIEANIQTMVEVVSQLPAQLASALQAAFPQLTASLQGLFAALQPLGAELSRIFSEFSAPIMEGLQAAWDTALPVVGGWASSILEAMGPIGEGIRSFFTGVGETIRVALDEGLAGAIDAVTAFVSNLTAVLQTITLDSAIQTVTAGIEAIKQLFSQLIQQIPPLLEQLKTAIADAFRAALDNAMAAVEAGLSRLYSAFQAGVDRIKALWNSVTSLFGGGGVAAATGGAAAPQLFAQRLMSPLTNTFNAVSRIGETAGGALAASGRGLFEEYVAGVTSLGNAAAQAVAPVQQLSAASNQLAQSSSQVGTATRQAATNIQGMAQQGAQAGQQLASSLGSTIGNALSGIISGTTKAKDAFKQMMQQILQQIIQFMMQQMVQQFMKGFMGGGMGGGMFGGLFGGGGGGMGGIFGRMDATALRAFSDATTSLTSAGRGRILARGNVGVSDMRALAETLQQASSGTVEVYNSSENNVDLNVRRGPDGVTIEVALNRATQEVLRGGTSFSQALERTYGLNRAGF